MVKKKTFVSSILFLLSFLIYFATSRGNTPYNHYILLADAFNHGRLFITKVAPWLEKVPIDSNNFYVANPPMPAVLAMPFVLIFGDNFPQRILSFLIGAGIVASVFFLALRIKNNLTLAIWSALLAGFGNIIWFLSADGSMWYLAQVTSVFFVILAINELFGKKRLPLISLFVSIAFLARIQMILYLPFFIFVLWKKIKKKDLIISALIVSLSITLFGLYNYLRFGSFFQTGLNLIPGLIHEPWFNKGLFNFSYIPDHLKILLAKTPVFSSKFPYAYPTLSGLAIWVTSPIFLVSLFNKIKEPVVLFSWATIIILAITNLSYGSAGISQFGYRYAVDFYPLLFMLSIKSAAGTGLKWHHWVLLTISIIVNAWGVIFINKLGLTG